MNIAVLIDGLVSVLLLVTCGYCFILDRKLRAMRGAQTEMQGLIGSLDAAATKARASLDAIRGEGVSVGERLQANVSRAKGLIDELSVMVDSGGRIASRLEDASVAAPRKKRPAFEGFDFDKDDDEEDADGFEFNFKRRPGAAARDAAVADRLKKLRTALGGVR